MADKVSNSHASSKQNSGRLSSAVFKHYARLQLEQLVSRLEVAASRLEAVEASGVSLEACSRLLIEA